MHILLSLLTKLAIESCLRMYSDASWRAANAARKGSASARCSPRLPEKLQIRSGPARSRTSRTQAGSQPAGTPGPRQRARCCECSARPAGQSLGNHAGGPTARQRRHVWVGIALTRQLTLGAWRRRRIRAGFEEFELNVVRIPKGQYGWADRIVVEVRRDPSRAERCGQPVEVGPAGAEGNVVKAYPVLAEPVAVRSTGRRAQHQPGPRLSDSQA